LQENYKKAKLLLTGYKMKIYKLTSFIFIIIFSIIFLFLSGCSSKNSSEKEHSEEIEEVKTNKIQLTLENVKIAGIKMETVSYKNINQSLSVPGIVSFNEKQLAHITARVTGRVEKVHVFVGDEVTEKDVLVSIYSQEYVTAQSEFIQAKERLERSQERNDSGEITTAKAIYESSRQKLLIMDAHEDELQEILQKRVPKILFDVHSPISGIVIESDVILDSYIELGRNIMKVADLSTLWIIADIYEKDVERVRPGLFVTVQVPALPKEKFPGKLTTIYGAVDEKTRTIKTRIVVDNSKGKLKPQMFATVSINTNIISNALTVPRKAILTEGNTQVLFVALSDTLFEKRYIETGTESQEYVEILKGIKSGEKIVTEGTFTLKAELEKSALEEHHH
jgi:RND family efflux transporter MFP subunit